MGVHIESDEFERLARRLADRRGTSVDEALAELVRRELERGMTAPSSAEPGTAAGAWPDDEEVSRRKALTRGIQARIAAAPTLDPRPYRETLYDEDGLPR